MSTMEKAMKKELEISLKLKHTQNTKEVSWDTQSRLESLFTHIKEMF